MYGLMGAPTAPSNSPEVEEKVSTIRMKPSATEVSEFGIPLLGHFPLTRASWVEVMRTSEG